MQMRPTNATSEQSGSTPAHWLEVAHSSEQNEPASGGPSTQTELAQALPLVHASTPLRPVPRAPTLQAQPALTSHSQRSAAWQSRLNEHIAPSAPGPSMTIEASSAPPSLPASAPASASGAVVVVLAAEHERAIAAATAMVAETANGTAERATMAATSAMRPSQVPRNLARGSAQA
jgi:hypothetical protein